MIRFYKKNKLDYFAKDPSTASGPPPFFKGGNVQNDEKRERGNSFAKQTKACHPELDSGSQDVTGDSPLSLTLSLKGRGNKAAFTLAEVLITLAIIGVVAALTMPTLIQKHRNQIVETRLKKFYSNINQAVQLAEAEYGDKKIWWQNKVPAPNSSVTEKDDISEYMNESKRLFEYYLAPYLQITKTEILENDYLNFNGTSLIYFPDGSAIANKTTVLGDWYFFPANAKKCIEKYAENGLGICMFGFQFNPNAASEVNIYNKGFEPYKFAWDGTLEGLYDNPSYYYTGCNKPKKAYCTALIQYNGWKIPKNYPYKVRY